MTGAGARVQGARRTPRAPAPEPEWLSITTVAARLSVSRRQTRKWIDAGMFGKVATFSPRVIRISVKAFEQFVHRQRNRG